MFNVDKIELEDNAFEAGFISSVNTLRVTVDLPTLNYEVPCDDPAYANTMLQATITLSPEMRIVASTNALCAFLDHGVTGSTLAKLIPANEVKGLHVFLLRLALELSEGRMTLPHVAVYGPIKLYSSKSSLSYRATLMVCFPAGWHPQAAAVMLSFMPVHREEKIVRRCRRPSRPITHRQGTGMVAENDGQLPSTKISL